MEDIRKIVFDNLDAAKEGGAFEHGEYLDDETPEVIADDMVAYAEDCESYKPEKLLPHIKEWLAENV